MEDATSTFTKADAAPTKADTSLVTTSTKANGSSLFNVSVRGWLTLIVFVTASYMAVRGIEIKEPYYSLVFLVAGFYFGQATKPRTQGGAL